MYEALKEYLVYAAQAVSEFTIANAEWAPLIIFVLGFAESVAILSLLVPSTVILLAVGAIIAVGGLPLLPLIIAAAVGAFLGDWFSYTLGRWFKKPILNAWPMRTMPDAVARAERIFATYGFVGVFFGRFIGPLRAIVPLICGILQMPFLIFQGVNAASAICWATLVLGGGALLGESFERIRDWL
jgi:membrane protein DedA with SNARE-associated domain